METLHLTSKLLKQNPEYYTIWNHRRLVLRHQFSYSLPNRDPSEKTLALITSDLQFLVPLLRKFPKCYWVWNHRLWILQQSSVHLSDVAALRLRREELGLVNKMLSLDGRNFHGWGYRRTVIAALESNGQILGDSATKSAVGRSLAEEEFTYTTKMIGTDLSNFSAWHNRSKLIPRLLDERGADAETRRKFLDDGMERARFPHLHTVLTMTSELELIKQALYTDPYDQSLWFYHSYLMCTFDPRFAEDSMAPNLTDDCRLTYIVQALEVMQDLRECAEDCKWVYQALLQYTTLEHLLKDEPLTAVKSKLAEWLEELRKLDPLRKGRWDDLSNTLGLEVDR